MGISSKKCKLVISDFHLADGEEAGTYNPWESFHHDDKLCEFLEYYSSGFYADEQEIELIINGDFIDFLQIRYNGVFPTSITREIAVDKMNTCIKGHPKVWNAIKEFISKPGKTLTILPGNHDIELVFPEVQNLLLSVVGHDLAHKVRFIELEYFFDGILIHHGHQYETVHKFDLQDLYLSSQISRPPVNIPFGSYYLLKVLYPLKLKRFYIDRVRPLKYYFIWAFIFDIFFAFKLLFKSLICFIRFYLAWRSKIRVFKALKELLLAFPSLEEFVSYAVLDRPEVKIVICGHSHVPKICKLNGGKIYFNSGTWTEVVSLDIAKLGTYNQMTYCLINYTDEKTPTVKLMEWKGFYNPMEEARF